jgi:multidrug efflux system membrane fusion protein
MNRYLPARSRILLSTAALVGLLLAGCSEPPPVDVAPTVRPVKVLKLAGSGAAITREFPGQVRAAQRADLSFEVAGTLQELPVREGQQLEEGDLVAALDDRDFASSLKSAQAEFNNALANFRRGSALVKDGNISKTDFDTLKSRRDVTSANLSKAEKAVSDTRLLAPFRGRVATRFVENFQDIQAKERIVSLQDIDELEILVDVPESQVIRGPRPGGGNPPKMAALFEAFPSKRYDLEVKEFSTQADPTTQAFRVVLSMMQPEEFQVLPGMSASVQVEFAGDADAGGSAFAVPAVAVIADEAGNAKVWVVEPEGNTVQARSVETGPLTGADSIQIVSGLEADEVIAISAVSRLREGMEIRPIERVEF